MEWLSRCKKVLETEDIAELYLAVLSYQKYTRRFNSDILFELDRIFYMSAVEPVLFGYREDGVDHQNYIETRMGGQSGSNKPYTYLLMVRKESDTRYSLWEHKIIDERTKVYWKEDNLLYKGNLSSDTQTRFKPLRLKCEPITKGVYSRCFVYSAVSEGFMRGVVRNIQPRKLEDIQKLKNKRVLVQSVLNLQKMDKTLSKIFYEGQYADFKPVVCNVVVYGAKFELMAYPGDDGRYLGYQFRLNKV